MDKLLPCPFCGGGAVMCHDGPIDPAEGDAVYYVVCDTCGSRTDLHIERQYAADAWNNRT